MAPYSTQVICKINVEEGAPSHAEIALDKPHNDARPLLSFFCDTQPSQEAKSTITGARSKSAAPIKVCGFNCIVLAKKVSGTISKRVL